MRSSPCFDEPASHGRRDLVGFPPQPRENTGFFEWFTKCFSLVRVNIQATTATPASDPCPAQSAQAQNAAGQSTEMPSFVELLVEAVEPAEVPATDMLAPKMPTNRKAVPAQPKQKDASETTALFFALLPQSMANPEVQAPLTLEAQVGDGTGNSEAQSGKQATAAVEAVEPQAPVMQLETPVAFTADISAPAADAPAPAQAPTTTTQRPKALTTEIPVKAEEAPQAAEKSTPETVATVQQPAPAKVQEQPRQERAAVVAHEAIRDSQPVTEVHADAVPATNKVEEIRIRVQGQDQQNAEVRVQTRGNEVHVAVKTTDAHLTESLRSDLGELVSRLERTGLDARVWQPAMTPATVETERSSQQQSFDDRQEQPQWNFSERQGRDRRRRDQQQQAFENQIEAIA